MDLPVGHWGAHRMGGVALGYSFEGCVGGCSYQYLVMKTTHRIGIV